MNRRTDCRTARGSTAALAVAGLARYAFRTRRTDVGISSVDQHLDVYTVAGKRLVNVRAQADGFKPGKRKVVRLTKVALDRAG